MNDKSGTLGAFIPLIYHFAMLQDEQRMSSFRDAISALVFPGAKVLELGAGTGVLSFFAAQKAAKVYAVEGIPANAEAARRILADNGMGERVEVICTDAFTYLPPEPVDFVICEMLHVAMIRESQIEMIESFKTRYLAKFGGPLPRFIPEAFIQGIQPIEHKFEFYGYKAPIPLFEQPGTQLTAITELGDPIVYQMEQYKDALSTQIKWAGPISISKGGRFNALRFVLKNVLAILPESNSSINWHNHYLVIPLQQPMQVNEGDLLFVSFVYQTGCEVDELISAISVTRLNRSLPKAETGKHPVQPPKAPPADTYRS